MFLIRMFFMLSVKKFDSLLSDYILKFRLDLQFAPIVSKPFKAGK